MEATKSSEPLTQRVASGDSASRQAVTRVNAEQASKDQNAGAGPGSISGKAAVVGEWNDVIPHDPAGVVTTARLPRETARNTGRLWTTTLLLSARVVEPRGGGEGYGCHSPGRRSAPSLTPAWRTPPARCMAEPDAKAGHRNTPAPARKTPPILPFITPKRSDQRLRRLCRQDAPSIRRAAFAAESDRPPTFSVRTGGGSSTHQQPKHGRILPRRHAAVVDAALGHRKRSRPLHGLGVSCEEFRTAPADAAKKGPGRPKKASADAAGQQLNVD